MYISSRLVSQNKSEDACTTSGYALRKEYPLLYRGRQNNDGKWFLLNNVLRKEFIFIFSFCYFITDYLPASLWSGSDEELPGSRASVNTALNVLTS